MCLWFVFLLLFHAKNSLVHPTSSPVPVVTSVSVPDISVMACMTAGTILMNETAVSPAMIYATTCIVNISNSSGTGIKI